MDSRRVGDFADDFFIVDVNDNHVRTTRDIEPPVGGIDFEKIPPPFTAYRDFVHRVVPGCGVLRPAMGNKGQEKRDTQDESCSVRHDDSPLISGYESAR
jgi:hypothetical protein